MDQKRAEWGVSKAELAVLLLVLTLGLSMYTMWQQQQRAEAIVLAQSVDKADALSQIARQSLFQHGVTENENGLSSTLSSLHHQMPLVRFNLFGHDAIGLDPFQQEAATAINSGDQAFWRLEPKEDGTYHVRHASRIVMKESCVACHNRADWGHSKTDWAVGDTRGIWEVTLAVPRTDLQSPVDLKPLVTLQFFACVLGLLLVLPVVQHEVAKRTYFETLSTDLNALAETDVLSGLANRRAFDATLQTVFQDSGNTGYGLIVLDIDHFKSVNDTYGHDVGDEVIRQIAEIIAQNVRPGDMSARYGGEEFAVICPDVTRDELLRIAERICTVVAANPVRINNTEIPVTVSGGATMLETEDDQASFFRRADRQLYKAKSSGRNQIVMAG